MYSWAGRDRYGKIALYNAEFAAPQAMLPAEAYLANGRANLQAHLLPFIQEHPETCFDIFFPPYSAALICACENYFMFCGFAADSALFGNAFFVAHNARRRLCNFFYLIFALATAAPARFYEILSIYSL